MVSARPSFRDELRRRNVLRPAALYAGAVWALSQGISQLSPALGLPDDATRWFLIACVVGFPFWIAFAWYFAITPEGIKRESEVAADATATHSIARKFDFAIIGVLALAVVLLGSGYFVRRHAPAGEAAAGPFNPPADSLVVLPFKNLSGDPKQQYFSDGITEELTDALGQNPALRVIAWATAATLRDLALAPNAVGRRLDVANILNGSILRAGDDVRITAELVDARNGVQLWSHHYDGSFANVFKMQDQVSASIADALKVKFAKTDLPEVGTRNAQAHELVLKGRALVGRRNAADVEAARKDFEQAIALDPNYAEAHANLASALIALTGLTELSLEKTLPKIRAEAQKAVALDPRSSHVWVALATALESSSPPALTAARTAFRKALALDPSNAAAHMDYGTMLPLEQGVQQEILATQLDPANETAWNNLGAMAEDLSDWAQVIQASQALIKLDPADVDSAFGLALAYQHLHQRDKMVAAFDLVKPATPLDQQQVDAGRLTYRALGDPALRPQAVAALQALASHASNPDVAANLTQLNLALGEDAAALSLLGDSCAAMPLGSSDLGFNPIYRPLHASPVFRALAKKYTT
ncbi:MAG: tetratricopeptide repeat protein, partial [Rhodanobacteraceae bacterium]